MDKLKIKEIAKAKKRNNYRTSGKIRYYAGNIKPNY